MPTPSRGGGHPAGLPALFLLVLARLGAGFPLEALGRVRATAGVRSAVAALEAHGVGTARLVLDPDGSTPGDPGARLAPGDLALDETPVKILHVGPPSGLPGLDAPGPGGTTGWEALARAARNAGVRVSLSVRGAPGCICDSVTPLLPLLDYLFIDAPGAAAVAGIGGHGPGAPSQETVRAAAAALLKGGVGRWVVVRSPGGVFALNPGGFAVWQPGIGSRVALPQADDASAEALAAGVLFAIHDHWPMDEALKVGVAAVAALAHAGGDPGGVPPLDATMALARSLGSAPGPASKR